MFPFLPSLSLSLSLLFLENQGNRSNQTRVSTLVLVVTGFHAEFRATIPVNYKYNVVGSKFEGLETCYMIASRIASIIN